MVMEYIHGTTADILRDTVDSATLMYGTDEQDSRFPKQMAKIQTEISSFKFPQIGSLYYSEESSEFYIGLDLNTGMGPLQSAADYYYDLSNDLLRRAATRAPKAIKESPAFILPVLLVHLLGIYGKETEGPLRLFNKDLGAHNILVDDDFNIVGRGL